MPTITNYHWDPVDDCVLLETDQTGNTLATYTHESGTFGPLLSENRAGNESYRHNDALGSTRILTNNAGTVTDTFRYDAWGINVARTGTAATTYKWVGEVGYQTDSQSGNIYVRSRTYTSSNARWLSPDPLGFVNGPNRYAYSGNNPVTVTDPTGNDFIAEADRLVKIPLNNVAYHYSLQYWKCCPGKVEMEKVYQSADLEALGCTKKKAMELIAARGYCCKVRGRFGIIAVGRRIAFGYIQYKDTSKRVMPIYESPQALLVSLVWDRMMNVALNYPFAEQSPSINAMRNWPNSFYKSLGVNSNGFARYVVNNSGLFFVEMRPGAHPGSTPPPANSPPGGGTFEGPVYRPNGAGLC